MTAYCVGRAKIKDREPLLKYREGAADALAKHGGSVVMASPNLVTLDGEPEAGEMIVILSFPTEQAALDWRQDEELAELHGLRNASGDWKLQILAAPA